MPFVNVVTIIAKQGKADTIVEHLAKIKKEVDANEPGTKKYHSAQNKEKPEEIYLWEEYDNEEALAIHRDGEAYKAFKAVRDEWIDGLTINTCNIIT